MAKINSCEKFFLGKIAEGLEIMSQKFTKEDIELLLSSKPEFSENIVLKFKNSLDFAYKNDLKQYKDKLTEVNPEPLWENNIVKLYKGRDNVLRDLVIQWYISYQKPGIFSLVKSVFKKNF
ncbi:hypothetical protein Q428_00170 [Fervidicella metallireducens AeB]|uniref:Uncharacterized protein n=1 Tax=Fervidicella metallireducens AeB TaxID=1403537 RepID=A0A017RZN2_9CLOT|nr:hypothetical protein [Fervidicella metallireducens]EYE89859.1 hypothetical protein Q428_00170 [Fervidicella metallireducens AeB]